MRLVCPACRAAYNVPADRLGSGPRRLRCARCAHEWTAEPGPEPPPALAQAPAPPAFAPLRAPAVPRPDPLQAGPRFVAPAGFPDFEDDQPPGPDLRALAAWAASLVVVVGMVMGAVQFRNTVMHAWPPSQRLYGLFGATLP